jgi:subtilase family serine protease
MSTFKHESIMLGVAALFVPAMVQGQTLSYISAQSAAPFVPLTGGTAVPFGSATADDDAANVPIGFNFTYFGTVYGAVNVAVNGVVELSSSCTTDAMCPNDTPSFPDETCNTTSHFCDRTFVSSFGTGNLPNTSRPFNLIAAWFDDLKMDMNSRVTYATLGSAPNREFVVEWLNIHRYEFGSASMSQTSFQVRLRESGNITIAYGTYTPSAADNADWHGGIGIENADASQTIIPIACAMGSGVCDFMTLQGLANQTFQFFAPMHADLAGSVSGPTGAQPGDNVQIPLRVKNVGVQSTAVTFSADIYLSRTATVNPMTAPHLGTLSFPVLTANAVHTSTLSARVPVNTTPGKYRIVALIDRAGAVRQDVGNATAVSPNIFLIGNDASVSIDPVLPTGPEDVVRFPLQLLNNGGAVASVDWAVYFSLDNTFEPMSDHLIARGSHALPAVPVTTITVTTTIPADLMPNDYYAIAVVDPDNRLVEADETNNIAIAASTTTLRGPDIYATTVSGSEFAFRGSPYILSVTMRNTGLSPATNFYYGLYLSTNNLITFTDPSLGEFGPMTLMPGEAATFQKIVTISSTIAPGPYYLGMIVDSRSNVLEQNENNNVAHSTATIAVRDPAPDFAGMNVLVPATAAAGESFTVARTLSNIGNAPATLTYAVYLTMTASINPTRDYLIEMKTIQLAAMQDDMTSDVLHVPGNVPGGNYYVGYLLDPMNEVAELRESNNAVFSSENLSVVASSLSILTHTLPIGTLTLPYEASLAASGGSGAYSWALTAGDLPPGLMLDGSRGWISGTPTMEGLFNFTLSVTDGHLLVKQDYHLLIAAETAPLEVITRSLIPAFAGRAYEYPLTAFGGVPPYTWQAQDRLPAGLRLSSAGLLTGTASAATVVTVNFQVTDAAGKNASRPIVVRVINDDGALRFASDVLADGRVGEAYNQSVKVESGTGMAPYTFDVASGQLPPGLELQPDMDHPEQAIVQGTPSEVGTFTVGIRVRDARNDFDTNIFVVEIDPGEGIGFATTSLPSGQVGKAYVGDDGAPVKVKAVSANAMGAISYSLVSGQLPPGLSIGSDGVIQGTPTSGGIYSFVLAAKDVRNQIDVAAFGILIKDVTMTMTSTKSKGGCSCSTTAERGLDLRASIALILALLGLFFLLRAKTRAAVTLAAGIALLTAFLIASPTAFSQPANLPYSVSSEQAAYVSRTGTALMLDNFGPDNDEGLATATLPFPFKFYGTEYSSVTVSANGIVSFDQVSFLDGYNTRLPDPSGFTFNLIAPFWDDLVVSGVITATEGIAPNRRFIIQWNGVHAQAEASTNGTFQLWLIEGPGNRFEVHYGPLMGTIAAANWSGTAGFEDRTGQNGGYLLACQAACDGNALRAADGLVYRAEQDGGVDVIATSLMAPPVIYPGIHFDYQATLASVHQVAIGPFVYQLHLVPEGTIMPNNPIFTSGPITLAPYQNLIVTASVAAPLLTMPGRYHLALVADAMNQVMEVNENNNVFTPAEGTRVEPRRPDFKIARISMSAPFAIAPGSTRDISIQISNAGNLDSQTTWGVYLSRNEVISSDDVAVANGMVMLPLQTTSTVSVHLEVPSTATPGTYFLGALADPANGVEELDEANNAMVLPNMITISSDMVSVTTTALPRGYEMVDYDAFLAASGGDGTYTWSITSGSLPAGLNLVAATGEIHGVPMMKGTSAITVQVESAGHTAMASLMLEVAPVDAGLTIVTRELLPGIVGDAYPPSDPGTEPDQQQHIVVVSAMGDVMFTLTSTPPPGLMLDADGYLHGTPQTRGVFDVAVKATDAVTSAERTIPLTIGEQGRLSVVAAVLPDGRIGEDYQYQIRVVGSVGTSSVPPMFTAVDPLPLGLSLGSTGLVSGIPQKTGTTVFLVKASDNGSPPETDVANFRITIIADAGFKITPTTLPQAVVGEAYDQVLDAVLEGGDAAQPITWRVQGSALPKGLVTAVRDDNGKKQFAINGTPTEEGFTTVLVSADDALGRHAAAPISIYVVKAPPAAPAAKKSGCSCSTTSRASGWGGVEIALVMLALVLGKPSRRSR